MRVRTGVNRRCAVQRKAHTELGPRSATLWLGLLGHGVVVGRHERAVHDEHCFTAEPLALAQRDKRPDVVDDPARYRPATGPRLADRHL
jgi:hypothetical protein